MSWLTRASHIGVMRAEVPAYLVRRVVCWRHRRGLQLGRCCRRFHSDRERGEQLGCVPGVPYFGTHLLAHHDSSQKTPEDIVFLEHGKDNWYRDTATTTMLTRGNNVV